MTQTITTTTAADSYNTNFVAPETAHNAAMNSAIRQRPTVIAAGIIAMRHADAAKAEASAGNKNDAFKSALKHVSVIYDEEIAGYGGIGDWSFMADRDQRTHATALRALGKRFQSDDIERLACKIDELLQQISDGIKSIAGIETAAKKLDKLAEAETDDDASDDDASDDSDDDASVEAVAPKRTKAEFLAWVQKQYATEFSGADFFADLEAGKMDSEIDFDAPANALTSS